MNIKVRRFPTVIIANMFGFEKKDMFEADEGAETYVRQGRARQAKRPRGRECQGRHSGDASGLQRLGN